MSETPSRNEAAIWQRRLASQANNRAWTLSESLSRTPEEDEEMLQAAHAAMSGEVSARVLWRRRGAVGPGDGARGGGQCCGRNQGCADTP